MTDTRIAILGAGNMGRALITGLLRSGLPRGQLAVGEPVAAARAALAHELGIAASADNAATVAGAAVAVLAVKPQDAPAVLGALAGSWGAAPPPLLISVAAGLRVAALEQWCGGRVAVVRAMPNRPALVGASATALFAPRGLGSRERALAAELFGRVGEVVWVADEAALDVVTALSGSGPAYFFLLAELMAAAAARLGLEPSVARRLAVATLHGAGLLAHTGTELARLREQITSRGGTTEAALSVLEGADLRGIMGRALAAATERGRELAGVAAPSAGGG